MRGSRQGARSGLWSRLAACGLLVGCGTVGSVELTEAARNVSEAQPEQVADCQKVATTRTRVFDGMVGFYRAETRVARELRDLARNEAVARGGNTVVATTPVENGRQSFDIYRCATQQG